MGLLPDPATFEVWFVHLSGTNLGLSRDLETLIASGEVSVEGVREIHDRHLSPQRTAQRLITVGESLREEAHRVGTLIGAAHESADTYAFGLDGMSRRLGVFDGHQTLQSIVSELIKSTDNIKRTNTRLQAQLKKSEAQVRSLQHSLEFVQAESITDPVTAVGNRKLFDQALGRLIEASHESGTALSLAIADVDHFKDFNDRFGHQIGDDVLRLVGTVIKQHVRGDDLICRYGGDEFAILLPRATLQDALAIGEALRRAVSEKGLLRRSTQQTLGRVSVSVGVAEHARGDAPAALVRAADACLLAAKRKGRNCVVG